MEVKPGYKRTEVGVIPEEWECLPIADLAAPVANAIVGGPFGSDLVSADYVHDGVPVIRGQNMGARYLEGPFAYVTEAKANSLAANLARPGDVVFTQRGTLGQVSLTPSEPFDRYLVSQSQMKVSLHRDRVTPNFLFSWSESNEGQQSIASSAIQTGVPHINLGILKSLMVPVPPVAEQRAIATALSDVDSLLTQLDQFIAKKRDIKQAAMQQLLTGKTRLPGFAGEWGESYLGECLINRPSYGINAPAVPFSDRLPTYLRITDIDEYGRVSSGTRVSVAHRLAHDFLLSSGDLVFARTGASVGKSYLYSPEDGELVFAGFLIRIRPDAGRLNPAFLAAYVQSGSYWQWVRVMSMRSGQPGINGNEYAQLPIPLPPIEEQTDIATLLADLDAELAALDARRAKTRALKQGMMQELLTGRTRLI